MMDNEDCKLDSAAGFYKIILPGIILQEKLRIPKNFTETFGDELSGFVTLAISDGRICCVELEKSEHMVFFSNGWQKLVDHYSISTGHMLIFKYKGNSRFNVFIFDITSTGIDHSSHAFESYAGPELSNEEEMSGKINMLKSQMNNLKSQDQCPGNSRRDKEVVLEKETVGQPRRNNEDKEKYEQKMAAGAEMAGPSRRNKAKFGASNHSTPEEEASEAAKLLTRDCFDGFLRKAVLKTQEKKTAELAARDFKSENSAFMGVIRLGDSNKVYQLDVPVEFSKRYLLPPGKVELEIEDGRRWTVYSSETEKENNGYVGVGGATLKRGWRTFIKENQLSCGDICIFELIHVQDVILKVSIFKPSN